MLARAARERLATRRVLQMARSASAKDELSRLKQAETEAMAIVHSAREGGRALRRRRLAASLRARARRAAGWRALACE